MKDVLYKIAVGLGAVTLTIGALLFVAALVYFPVEMFTDFQGDDAVTFLVVVGMGLGISYVFGSELTR